MAHALADEWYIVALYVVASGMLFWDLYVGAKWHVDVTGTLSRVMLSLSRPSRQSYANRFFAQLKN